MRTSNPKLARCESNKPGKTLEGDGADEADDGNLENGADDWGFDLSNYEGADSTPSTTAPLLPPHVKAARIAYHYEQQEQRVLYL